MICPECNIEMEEGELRFFASWNSRLIFSQKNVQAPPALRRIFREYIQLQEGQNEIKFKKPWWLALLNRLHSRPFVKSNIFSCPKCRIMILEDI